MFIKKLKILLKNWILVILFYNLISCGKEGLPHPPVPKEKIIKEVFFKQIGENIKIEINLPEKFKEGKIDIYFYKIKNPQKKEISMPPEGAVFKKSNLILSDFFKGTKYEKVFNRQDLKIDYDFSTFFGFYIKGKEFEEKTKIFQFLFLKVAEKVNLKNVFFKEEGIGFDLELKENCKNLFVTKEINKGIPVLIDLKMKENLFFDENVSHNSFYKYTFFCYDKDSNHLSEPLIYETLYKYEFKPPPPEEVILLEDNENLRIEFKKVQKAVKYKLYEKCYGGENWEFVLETDKNVIFKEKKFCKFGVSSLNEAGLESEIVEAKE